MRWNQSHDGARNAILMMWALGESAGRRTGATKVINMLQCYEVILSRKPVFSMIELVINHGSWRWIGNMDMTKRQTTDAEA